MIKKFIELKELDFENSTILVTGASGFIGSHVIKELLNQSFKVKAVVRSEKKKHLLASVFSEYKELLSFAIVEDICSFSELQLAMTDVAGILHLASPYTYSVVNFVDELLKPALEGTTTIMRAAASMPNNQIKRIVITSSFAAMFDASKGPQPGVVITESDFSPLRWEDGASTEDPAIAYRASKIVAELAAWEFLEKQKPSFDIAVICPPMVFGPLVAGAMIENNLANLNFSNNIVWEIASRSIDDVVPPTKGPVWVDVRDLAKAHVNALVKSDASNQRFLVSAGDFDNQQIADILRASISKEYTALNIPIGEVGKRLTGTHLTTDSSKAVKVLGITFTNFERTVTDLVNQLLEIQASKQINQ